MILKKLFLYLLIFISILAISSCSDDKKNNPFDPDDDADPPFNFEYKLIKTFNIQEANFMASDNNYIFTCGWDGTAKIIKYDFNGNLLIESNFSYTPDNIAVYNNKVYILSENLVKVLDYNLTELEEITLAEPLIHGSIYVKGDYFYTTLNHQVIKYSNNGTKLFEFGSYGSDNDQFNDPRDVVIDSEENYYVADQDNRRLKVFDENGNFKSSKKIIYRSKGDIMAVSRLAIDNNDNIYVGINENDYHAAFYIIKANGKEGLSNLDTDIHFQSDDITVTPSGLVVVMDCWNINKIKIYQP